MRGAIILNFKIMETKYAILAKKMALWSGVLAFVLFLWILKTFLQEPEYEQLGCGAKNYTPILTDNARKGKMLFINNCATCHNKNMKDKLTGPALQDWRNYLKDENGMLLFLHNSKAYLKNNKWLRKKMKEFEGSECVAFPNLDLEDVKAIIGYIDEIYYNRNTLRY